jgi:hypothetical protein
MHAAYALNHKGTPSFTLQQTSHSALLFKPPPNGVLGLLTGEFRRDSINQFRDRPCETFHVTFDFGNAIELQLIDVVGDTAHLRPQ